jgi:tetratricopeptide (TPR) repeat protein
MGRKITRTRAAGRALKFRTATALLRRGVFIATAMACMPVFGQTSTPKPPRSLAMPASPGSQPRQQAPVSTPQQRASYDAAFQATLDNPSNPETLVRFAELAIQIGDIEGAISALERLLLIDGNLPEVKLELGVLYYRLGAKDAAIMYLEAARAAPQAAKETRERAETFLKAAQQ